MPDNLICPNCGREYPWQVPREYCLSCKTEFLRGTCYVCRQYKDSIRHGKCDDCSREINKQYMRRKRAAARNDYAEWLQLVISMPKPIHALTEEEWLSACRYFNGCSMCDSPQIEARALFIPAHRGGTYTSYNVVPVCEKCANAYKQSIKAHNDPFSAPVVSYNAAQVRRMAVVKKYLKERYDEYRKSYGI